MITDGGARCRRGRNWAPLSLARVALAGTGSPLGGAPELTGAPTGHCHQWDTTPWSTSRATTHELPGRPTMARQPPVSSGLGLPDHHGAPGATATVTTHRGDTTGPPPTVTTHGSIAPTAAWPPATLASRVTGARHQPASSRHHPGGQGRSRHTRRRDHAGHIPISRLLTYRNKGPSSCGGNQPVYVVYSRRLCLLSPTRGVVYLDSASPNRPPTWEATTTASGTRIRGGSGGSWLGFEIDGW